MPAYQLCKRIAQAPDGSKIVYRLGSSRTFSPFDAGLDQLHPTNELKLGEADFERLETPLGVFTLNTTFRLEAAFSIDNEGGGGFNLMDLEPKVYSLVLTTQFFHFNPTPEVTAHTFSTPQQTQNAFSFEKQQNQISGPSTAFPIPLTTWTDRATRRISLANTLSSSPDAFYRHASKFLKKSQISNVNNKLPIYPTCIWRP